jgi:DNA (cytosine-5)-methyltransferase 1
MKIISLFSGCGGLDLGFKKAGFKIIWANDNSKSVWSTFESNFPKTFLCKKNLRKVKLTDLPENFFGIIGGPPCQSWSNAGNGKGVNDPRGQLFFDFIRILKEKKPLFFLAENVEGILSKRNKKAFDNIINLFDKSGYTISCVTLNAADFNVPQTRKRVFIVGYRSDMNIKFNVPRKSWLKPNVKDAIWHLRNNAIAAKLNGGNKSNGSNCKVPNHEYWVGGYSYIFMSRNRVLSWNRSSFTIQASGRQVSIHPSVPKMTKVKKDVMKFNPSTISKQRRLTVRECAAIQTFPDNFVFNYDALQAGYKMVGNAVPVNLAYALGKQIYRDLIKVNYQKFKLNGNFNKVLAGKPFKANQSIDSSLNFKL